MRTHHPDENIPEQETGAYSNTEHSYECNTVDEALNRYAIARERLLSLNHWADYAGHGGAEFQLLDKDGNKADRTILKGDFFRIDIPGPGTKAGEGYDWVQVEELIEHHEEDCDMITIRVRPSQNPVNADQNIAHFFSEKATSNFIIRRDHKKVTAGVYGRNEIPNTKTSGILDKARNAVIGGPAAAGISKLQWKNLVIGLIAK